VQRGKNYTSHKSVDVHVLPIFKIVPVNWIKIYVSMEILYVTMWSGTRGCFTYPYFTFCGNDNLLYFLHLNGGPIPGVIW
jgi:hypothetical protein